MRQLGLLIAYIVTIPILAQEQEMGMSLQQCIDYALENNEQLKITDLGKDDADAQVGEVMAIGLPQVNIDGGVNYNYRVQRSIVDATNFNPDLPEGTEAEIAFGLPYDGNIVLGARQLIFDGSYFVGLQAAKTLRELASKDHIRNEIDIIESVAKAYYTVLVNTERLELLDRNYSRLDTLLYETSQMFENGFAEKIDVDRIRVNFNNVRVDRQRARRLNDVAMNLLKFQMGMDLKQSIA
ncbi:MAG: TolC family protein, partial [Bacteroidota bacterium]